MRSLLPPPARLVATIMLALPVLGRAGTDEGSTWVRLVPVECASESGARIEPAPDHSVLVGGENPDKDVHTIVCDVELARLTGLRLEVLPHDSLPKQGPGRSNDGNFVLTGVEVESGGRFSKKLRAVEVARASASHSQPGFPVACTLDCHDGSGWAIRPLSGHENEVVFEFAEPVVFRLGPGRVQVRLSFQHGHRHVLGHYRLSATDRDPPLVAAPSPEMARLWPERQAKINSAIARGVDWLLEQQQIDGSWGEHQDRYPTGQTALVVFTLLKSGVPPSHPAVRRATTFLRSHPPLRTYSAGCQIMAFATLNQPEDRDRIEQIVTLLAGWQRQGGFGYPDGAVDLSNTQYAALGLHYAAEVGVKVPPAVWSELARCALRHQEPVEGAYAVAGFGYKPPPHHVTGSMTAAGVAILQICDNRLPRSNAVLLGLRRGLGWLAKNFSGSSNVRSGGRPDNRQLLYFLYGCERVAGLCALDRFGTHDWYREGATHIVGAQAKEGKWDNQSNTCFALLFLGRATSSSTGSGAAVLTRSYGEDDPAADVSLRASGDTPLTLWVSSFGDHIAQDLFVDGEGGRGLRIEEVRYYSFDEGRDEPDLLASVAGDPGRPHGGDRFPLQQHFERSGVYSIFAEVHCWVPGDGPEDPAERLVLESPPIEVRIREALDPRFLEYAADAQRNLLSPAVARVKASSELDGRWSAARAIDGLLAYGWMCKDGDAAPVLTVELERPLRANQIVFSHARHNDQERTARVQRVELQINGRGKPHEFELDPDDLTKSALDLPKTAMIRRIDVRVVHRTEGHEQKDAVGFAEVEVRYERKRKR